MKLWRLFVDDGFLAAAVLLWLAACVALRAPPLLPAGLAVILAVSVARAARRR